MKTSLGRWLFSAVSLGLVLAMTGCPANPGSNNTNNEETIVGTVHKGTISASETWTKAKNPHVITEDLHVENASGATLTLEPGVVVKFKAGTSLYFGYSGGTRGNLIAEGTGTAATESITFTAYDNPSKGAWGKIYIGEGGALTSMKYCTVSYGGHSDVDGAIVVSGALNKPKLNHCTIEQSGGYGIYVDYSAAFTEFKDNTIRQCDKHPLRLGAAAVGTIETGNTLTGNGQNAIHVAGETVSNDATWRPQGVPFQIFEHDLCVEGNTKPLLTLQAGCRVEFGQGLGLNVGFADGGALRALGTSENPIILTGAGSSLSPGCWLGLHFHEMTNDVTSSLDYVTISYGGGGGSDHSANLCLWGAKPTLAHLTLTDSAACGAYAWDFESDIIPKATIESALSLGERNATGNISYPNPQ